MFAHSLSHLSDRDLLRGLAALVARDRTTTAALLAHIAEVDARRLYLPAAYPSMYAYCVHELRLSEDAAYKRIQAARTARQFPAIFGAVASGRLHLSAVVLLKPYLTAENANEILKAATHKTKSEIEALIAERFPRSEVLAMVQAIPGLPVPPDQRLAPGQVGKKSPERVRESSEQLAPERVAAPDPRTKLAPVAPERFLLQLTIGRSTHDKLRYAQDLLSHEIPSGDVAQVLDRALDLLVAKLEKRKFAASRRQRPSERRPSPRRTRCRRHVPAHVKRAVWERDGGQCTFVSESGRRCPARNLLEFDHIDPVARGGRATVEGMRLRCRAHNQYGAECAFGATFMDDKRREARRAAAARARAAAREQAQEQAQEVIPFLRRLGFSAEESRQAAALCEAIPDASLEERVRRALSYFHPLGRAMPRPREVTLAGAPGPTCPGASWHDDSLTFDQGGRLECPHS